MDPDEHGGSKIDPAPAPKAESPSDPPGNRGLIGVVFVIALIGTAIWLMNRMQTYASLGDCAFTHAPQCRELIDK